ncbi:MAG: hypothetical protein LUG44_01130 [Clostridiales bacterium]|nr:hypothetical protein [Clostridiales bacterium]
MCTCKKNYTAADGEEKVRTFRVKDKKAANAYKAAGYTVTEEPAEETAAVKKATKSKAKAADTAD